MAEVRPRIADRAVAAAVPRAGAPEDLAYTERQLYFETCRVLLPVHRLPRRPRFTVPAPIAYGRFRRSLDRYRDQYGEPPGLLAAPLTPPVVAEPAGGAPPSAPDLYDYGLPRLLVCQHADIAAMLLANELHMEAACAIVAAGAPLPEPLRWGLERAGAPEVLVLHDASPDGQALLEALPDRLGPLGGATVTGLGLRPVHAASLHLVAEAGRAEVAAVNPARLLRTLRRLLIGARSRTRRPFALRRERAVGFLTWPEE